MSTIIVAENIVKFLSKSLPKKFLESISELNAELVGIWEVQIYLTCLQGA